jgi:hypothetical protein
MFFGYCNMEISYSCLDNNTCDGRSFKKERHRLRRETSDIALAWRETRYIHSVYLLERRAGRLTNSMKQIITLPQKG